jgi:hypothetical protein
VYGGSCLSRERAATVQSHAVAWPSVGRLSVQMRLEFFGLESNRRYVWCEAAGGPKRTG